MGICGDMLPNRFNNIKITIFQKCSQSINNLLKCQIQNRSDSDDNMYIANSVIPWTMHSRFLICETNIANQKLSIAWIRNNYSTRTTGSLQKIFLVLTKRPKSSNMTKKVGPINIRKLSPKRIYYFHSTTSPLELSSPLVRQQPHPGDWNDPNPC